MSHTWLVPIFKLNRYHFIFGKNAFQMKMKITMGNRGQQGKRAIWGNISYNWGNFDKLRHCRIPIHPPHHQAVREEHFLPGESGSILSSQPIEMAVRFIEMMLSLIEMEVSFKAAKITALQNCVLFPYC